MGQDQSRYEKAELWPKLFNEVYEDDQLTAEEEQLIADAIKNETPVEKIVDILKDNAKD